MSAVILSEVWQACTSQVAYSTLGSFALTHIKPSRFIKWSLFSPLTEFSSRFIFVLQVFFQHLKHFISKRDECLLTLQLPPTIGRSSNQLLSIHFLYATHILTISSLCCLCSTLQSSGPSLLLIMEILNLFTHSWHYVLCFSSCPVVFLSITARSYLCLHYVVCQTALHASLRNLSLGYRILVFKECYFYTI